MIDIMITLFRANGKQGDSVNVDLDSLTRDWQGFELAVYNPVTGHENLGWIERIVYSPYLHDPDQLYAYFIAFDDSPDRNTDYLPLDELKTWVGVA